MSRIARFSYGVLTGALTVTSALPLMAQQIYENWNTAACAFTDAAAFDLEQPTHLDRVEIWYNWAPNETAVPYNLSLDGQAVFSGSLARAECDPNQQAWCIARGEPGIDLAPGAYTVRTQRAAICQNAASNGEGFVRAFGSQVAEAPPAESTPPQSSPEPAPQSSEQQPSGGTAIEPAPSGSGVFVPSPN
jgi:hypothetical protein